MTESHFFPLSADGGTLRGSPAGENLPVTCKSKFRTGREKMAKDDTKHLGLRIDAQTHYKLRYLARYDGRSCNGEVLYLLRRYIEDFEREHGTIPPDDGQEG